MLLELKNHMPLYEFECHQCGAFEQFLSLKEYGIKNQESPRVETINPKSHSEHNHSDSHHHVSHTPWMVGH